MGDWTDLLPPISQALRDRYRSEMAEAGQRLADLVEASPRDAPVQVWQVGGFNEVSGWPRDEQRRAALVLYRWTARAHHVHWSVEDALGQMLRRTLPWTRADLIWLLHEFADRNPNNQDYFTSTQLRLVLAVAEHLDAPALDQLRDVFAALTLWLDGRPLPARDRRQLMIRLGELAGRAALEGSQALPPHLLHDGDAFGPTARAGLADLLAEPGIAPLLIHCARLEKVEPPRKWRTEAARLAGNAARGVEAARALLDLFTAHSERSVRCDCYGREHFHVKFVHSDTESLVRGLIWVVAERTDDWVTPLLGAVTTAAATSFTGSPGYPRAPRVANAAVLAFSRRSGDLPLRTLARLSLTVRNKALLSRLHAVLAEMGALRGWPLDQVRELAVSDHGLDVGGQLVLEVGDYEAVVAIQPGATKATLAFQRGGKGLRGVPAAVRQRHTERLAEVRALVKEIGKTLTAERVRVEELLAGDRVWGFPDWVERYLRHPVTGTFGRSLLWQIKTRAAGWRSGVPRRRGDGWALVDLNGDVLTGERVRLWHPLRADADEVACWRDQVASSGLRQPFKQAFREVYLLTPAEEETRAYSNRFAGHILRYPQAGALMRARGWQANHLGYWDGGYNGEAHREFAGGTWRAMFYYDLVESEDRGYEVRYCSTDQVRFARRDGAIWVAAPVTEVPAVVLSEAMRDVDLFVGVTSIAADPEWRDQGEERFASYWERTAFGDLTASAQVRREALARLLPRTRIADAVELGERFLRVRGRRRSYKIHLGSGNILMEPNDAYLCIVVASRGRGDGIMLPFEDDTMLSGILSKAFLLAADDKITDRTILAQLGR